MRGFKSPFKAIKMAKIHFNEKLLMSPEDVKKFIELLKMNQLDAEIGYDKGNKTYTVVITEE